MRLTMPAILAATILFCGAGAVVAQDAAETAIILGGTGTAQGRAQRSLGSAISRSMGNAANAVAAANANRQRTSQTPRRRARGSGKGGGHFAIALPGDVDPLAATDAPVYALGNGASIRVSGGLRRREPGITANTNGATTTDKPDELADQ